jgi:UDP-glucose 4-epimerase
LKAEGGEVGFKEGKNGANRMRKTVVTGGAGFIGSHLTDALVSLGIDTVVVDNLSSGSWEKIPRPARDKVSLVESNCLAAGVLDEAFRNAECVFHLAAVSSVEASLRDPLASVRSGEMALLGVLESARRCGVPKVVYASSAAVYGDPVEIPITEEHATMPLSYYGVSKLAGEHYLRCFALLSGATATALRFFNVYGPRQDPANPYSGAISKFIAAAEARKHVTIFGDGQQTRDFVHVSDVVDALLAAGERDNGEFLALNVASGKGTSVNELAALVADVKNSTAATVHAAAREGEIRNSLGDTAEARSLLGFEAKVSLAEGLRRM